MACCGVQTQDAYCCIQLLNGSEIDMNLELKMRGSDLLDHVFTHLNLVETDYFGLRFIDADNQTHWLNPEKLVTKQLKSVNPMTLYFGVKFYVEDPTRLAEEVTRYQFFLQLKMDMLQGRLPCSFSLAAELFAYAVQSELGDYDADLHPPGYVSEFRFVPNQTEELEKATAEQHKKLVGMLPAKAELGFLERGKRLEMYGVDLTPVTGQDRMEYFLGTTPSGVVVYRNKTKIVSYSWSKIKQMNFRHTEFRLVVGDKECVWLLPSRSSCKHLFQCYVEQHMFFRLRPSMLERNGTLNKSIKSNGSRYSFRTQEEALQNSMRLRRPEPHVQRVASRRYLRRVSTNDADDSKYIDHSSIMASPNPALENGMVTPGRVQKTMAPEPVRRSQSQMSGRESPTSGISIRSVPWEETDGALAERGMYTQRGESPVSTRSAHRSRRPNSRASSPGTTRHRRHHGDKSGSETESISSRKYRYRRSLTGSEASEDEASYRRRRRRRRSRSRESSGSEGEHRHRSRRSRSRDHMVESEAQWNAVQTGDGGQRGEVREPGEAVVKNLKNGVGSPEESEEYKWYKGRRQLADIKASTELRKHIQLGLQEPPSQEIENPLDIPYTSIVTDAGVAVRVSHSPTRQRSRPNSGAYRRSRGEFHDDAESVHSGKESVHSMRSTATRRTDPGSHNARSGNATTAMPLDLIQSGQGGQSRSPVRLNYESDGQRGRRKNRGQQDEMSEAESVRGGGGSIPSYLLAQRGQGMFSQKPGANPDNHTTSAINNNHLVNRRVEMANRRTETSVDQPSSHHPTPPAYVPVPVYVSSDHAPSVARSNQDRVPFEAPSARPGVHHTREDSGFEQEETYHSTRSHQKAPIANHSQRQSPNIHVQSTNSSGRSFQGNAAPHLQSSSRPEQQHPQSSYRQHQQHPSLPITSNTATSTASTNKNINGFNNPTINATSTTFSGASKANNATRPHGRGTVKASISNNEDEYLPPAKLPPTTLKQNNQESHVEGRQKFPADGNSNNPSSKATSSNFVNQGQDYKPKHLLVPNGGAAHLQHRGSYDSRIDQQGVGKHPAHRNNGLLPPAPGSRGRIHSTVDIMAVNVLLNELDKLGKGARGSNRSVTSGRGSIAGGDSGGGSVGGGGDGDDGGVRRGSYAHPLPARQLHTQPQPDFIPRHDIHQDQPPIKVSGNKRMSITTQEILRVSRSEGENRNMLTEL